MSHTPTCSTTDTTDEPRARPGPEQDRHEPELGGEGAEGDDVGQPRAVGDVQGDGVGRGPARQHARRTCTLRRLSLSTQAGPLATTFWNPVRK